jgi:malonyl-CoA decarboxylase
VVDELQDELPQLRHFATLSPLPRLREIVAKETAIFTDQRIAALLGKDAMTALGPVQGADIFAALDKALAAGKLSPSLRRGLEMLTLAYLMRAKREAHAADPVAHFHLGNGARLERIDVGGDLSAKGLHQSFGVMVNYLYDPKSLEANHERYVASGEVPLSRKLQSQAEVIAKLWL